jgi:predicted acetyltransferase
VNRVAYLSGLPFFQELYVEWLINDSSMYIIKVDNQVAGYACVTKSNKLVEFYLLERYFSCKDEIFLFLIKSNRIEVAIVKSFDYLFLATCNKLVKKVEPIGCLFRNDDITQSVPLDKDFLVEVASVADFPALLEERSGLYETEEELRSMLDNRQITRFMKGTALIGCGFKIRVHDCFDYCDIGMWVSPSHRRQGYAKQIIGYLKRLCQKETLTPICGCAIDNIASKKALEANGFNSIHHLLEYQF